MMIRPEMVRVVTAQNTRQKAQIVTLSSIWALFLLPVTLQAEVVLKSVTPANEPTGELYQWRKANCVIRGRDLHVYLGEFKDSECNSNCLNLYYPDFKTLSDNSEIVFRVEAGSTSRMEFTDGLGFKYSPKKKESPQARDSFCSVSLKGVVTKALEVTMSCSYLRQRPAIKATAGTRRVEVGIFTRSFEIKEKPIVCRLP